MDRLQRGKAIFPQQKRKRLRQVPVCCRTLQPAAQVTRTRPSSRFGGNLTCLLSFQGPGLRFPFAVAHLAYYTV